MTILAVDDDTFLKEHDAADGKRQVQKLAAMGLIMSEVVHDFNNLLAVILGNSELLVESLTNDTQRELAKVTVGAAERAFGLTRQFLACARKQPMEPKPVSVDELIKSVHSILKCAVSQRIEIRHIGLDGLWQTELDANQLEVALLNLAINARDAMPDGGVLTIQTSNFEIDQPMPNAQMDVPPGQYVRVSLTDTGTGMSAETMARVYEPFFSTKKTGMGNGLGLSMVRGFVTQSHGHIQLISSPGKGTTCNLFFPRSVEVTSADPKNTPPPCPMGVAEHILLVEDDPLVRDYLVSLLGELGYRVTFAASGEVAAEILRSEAVLDLLLTDIMMPGGVNGKHLAELAYSLRPGIKVLFVSGYPESTLLLDGRLEESVPLLTKPFRRREFARRVRMVLDAAL